MSDSVAELGHLDQQSQGQSSLAIRPRDTLSILSQPTMQTERMAGRRRSAISQRHWNMHKAKIERLFLFEGKTLPEIMQVMVQDHDFYASTRMYKTQLKHWQFGKYLRKDELSWMHWKADQRRREKAKDTEFLYRGQKYTSTMVQQRLDRRRIQRPPTPPSDLGTPRGLDYATPVDLPLSPVPSSLSLSPHRTDGTEEHYSGHLQTQTHEHVDESTEESAVAVLLRIRNQAENCEENGEIQLAEKFYREAFSGLESLLSNIHEDTIDAAYLLATFYARRGRMQDADVILDRVTTSHLDHFSAIHPRTAKHLFHVMKFYDEWSRADDRDVFALRIFESLSDHARAACSRLRATHEQIGPKTPHEIDQQLDRLKYRAESELHNARTFILGLIKICDADIVRLGEQGLKCRIQLIQILHQQYCRDRELPMDDKDKAIARELSRTLTSSEAFLKRLWRSDIRTTASLIGSSIQLAWWFVKLQHYDRADCTFTVIAHQAHNFFLNAQDSKSLIHVLLYIGILYQSEGRWDDARPHFEHALMVCSQTREHEGLLELLEEALRERIFRTSKLPLTFKPGIIPW